MKTKSNTTNALRGLLSGLLLLAAGTNAHAVVTLEWVTVGDVGNANDSTGYGGVAYQYDIMKYEVTNHQYAQFLNAKAATDTNALYNNNMNTDAQGGITQSGVSGSYTYNVKSGYADKPVVFVSTQDAQRFANWINNGQGAGDTETGAYAVGNLAVHGGLANVWIPTENEWYKAAYYQPQGAGGDTDSYWLYPTTSNTLPTSATSPSVITGAANIYNNDGIANGINGGYAVTQSTSFVGVTAYLTDVGSYSNSASYYGTFDQAGNVSEWNEAIIGGTDRGVRGSNWDVGANTGAASFRSQAFEGAQSGHVGFRLASAFVAAPEPSRAVLLLGGLMGVVMRRRRCQA